MNTEQFNQVVESRIQKIKSIFIDKAAQYARGDRLSNFKKAAAFRGKEPEEILMGLVIKYITALDDFVQDLPGKVMPIEQWDEKSGDIINYMILLEGLIRERMGLSESVLSPDTLKVMGRNCCLCEYSDREQGYVTSCGYTVLSFTLPVVCPNCKKQTRLI